MDIKVSMNLLLAGHLSFVHRCAVTPSIASDCVAVFSGTFGQKRRLKAKVGQCRLIQLWRGTAKKSGFSILVFQFAFCFTAHPAAIAYPCAPCGIGFCISNKAIMLGN